MMCTFTKPLLFLLNLNLTICNLCKNGGGKELFSEALKYLERSLGVAKANNDSELITRAESMISTVRANFCFAQGARSIPAGTAP